MSKPLFDADSDSGEEVQLGTNKEYAKSYNTFRQKELLKKLKDRDDSDSESDSESDSSDDDLAVNPQFDEDFYKTLASLKQKDPIIYNKNTRFFDEAIEEGNASVKEKKAKALTVKDYERKVLLEKGGIYEDDEEDGAGEADRPSSPTYVEEQKSLKNEFKKIIHGDSDEEEGGDWGGIFKKREKTKEEATKEEEEHQKWLADPANAVETSIALKPLKDYWSNPRLSRDEIFLRDYILSNGYADKDVDEIPTYDEIVGGSDDDFEQQQTEFEHKYNFRFEEPDKDFIKRYPRTIDQSVRKTDDRRKVKRVEVRERKHKEKEEKLKEIEILKEFKRKEIEEKMQKLKAVIGDEEMNLEDIDLDEDFDPEAHDKRMQTIFNNEYYEIDEGEEKPEVPSDIEDLQVENYDDYEPEQADEDVHCEDDAFNMDCEYDAATQRKSLQEELIESTRDKRKRRKRKSKFMEMLERDRPKFNPEYEKTYGEYLDEYYKLDCEDVIGDTQCRFKYVETTPNDFGLSIEEILLAKNKELNAWASMKKTTQIRPEHVDRNEQEAFRRKARNEAMKRKILQSLYEVSEDEEPEVVNTFSHPVAMKSESVSKNKKKKQRKQTPSSTIVSGALNAENQSQVMEQLSQNNHSNDEASVTNETSLEKNDPARQGKKMVVKKESVVKEESIVRKEPIVSNEPVSKIAEVTTAASGQKRKHIEVSDGSDGSSLVANNKKKKAIDLSAEASAKPAKKNQSNSNISNKKPGQSKLMPMKPFKNFKKPNDQNKIKTKGLSDERLKAFGINPKKFQKKLKYGQKDAAGQSTNQPHGNSAKKQFQQQKQQSSTSKKLNQVAHKNKLKKFLNKSASNN